MCFTLAYFVTINLRTCLTQSVIVCSLQIDFDIENGLLTIPY